MKKNIGFLFILFLSSGVFAQQFRLTSFVGTSNYGGELQNKKFTFDQSNFAAGLGLTYELNEQLYLTGALKLGKLTADDKKSPKNKDRNLSFSSPLTELNLGLEYDFLNLNLHSLTPYVFGGIAVYHFNPSTLDSTGNKVYLQPLSTEGEGFVAGRKKYSLNQISIPFGGGIKFALTPDIRVGVEIGLRKLFTDYIDDVSTNYVDRDLLLASKGQQSVDLAFRGGELKSGITYPSDGTTRGNPKSKDWYYFTGLTVSFNLGTGKTMGHQSKSNTGCPTSVY